MPNQYTSICTVFSYTYLWGGCACVQTCACVCTRSCTHVHIYVGDREQLWQSVLSFHHGSQDQDIQLGGRGLSSLKHLTDPKSMCFYFVQSSYSICSKQIVEILWFYIREMCLGGAYNKAQKICHHGYLLHPQRMNNQDFLFKFWSCILQSVVQQEVKGQHLFSQFPSKQQRSQTSSTVSGPLLELGLAFHRGDQSLTWVFPSPLSSHSLSCQRSPACIGAVPAEHLARGFCGGSRTSQVSYTASLRPTPGLKPQPFAY